MKSKPEPSKVWTGGANVPTTNGVRVNASAPLGLLSLTGDRVELLLRGPLVKSFQPETLIARPVDLKAVFPIRFRLTRTHGVGFQRPDGREYYFGTWRKKTADEILGRLLAAGFPVASDVRRPTKFWGLTP